MWDRHPDTLTSEHMFRREERVVKPVVHAVDECGVKLVDPVRVALVGEARAKS